MDVTKLMVRVFCVHALLLMHHTIDGGLNKSVGWNLRNFTHEMEELKTTQTIPSGSYIIDGQKAGKEEFPYIVALSAEAEEEYIFGAGVIIEPQWVVTAHHLIESSYARYKSGLLVIPKYDNRRSIMKKKKKYQVAKYFCSKDRDGDLALIKLREPIPLNQEPHRFDKIEMIEGDRKLNPKTQIIIIGWGLTESEHPAEHLMKVDAQVKPDGECSLYTLFHGPKHFCATDGSGGIKGSCRGDSGGPVIVRDKSKDTLIGIVSGGSPDCRLVS